MKQMTWVGVCALAFAALTPQLVLACPGDDKNPNPPPSVACPGDDSKAPQQPS